MKVREMNQHMTTVVQHRIPSCLMVNASIEVPLTSDSRNIIERIKNVKKFLRNQKSKKRLNEHLLLRQLILNAQTIDDTSSSSSTLTFIEWILRGLGPEFQQRQKNYFQEQSPERIVNVADIILAIPASEMDVAIQAVDSFGSNIFHLACYHGMDVHILNYILDNCSLESLITAVSLQDKAGNLPLFVAVESILRGKIEVRQGQEVVKRLYFINPKAIHHFNKDNCIVSEYVYDYIRHMHGESDEYQQLQMLHTYLRKLIKQAYFLRKKEWEERAQRPAMKLVDASTQDITEY